LANHHADFVLIPEVPFALDGESGFLAALERRVADRGSAVVVVAEGAGQDLMTDEQTGTDASGNRKLGDIGRFLEAAIIEHYSSINRELTLGLFEFEGHYAHYAPGAHYARHRDRFRDDDARVLSCVLYLNEGWCDENGGALRLYVDPGSHRDVLPVGGTLAIFLSAQFEHEVLPATRSRWSIAGWFRRRAREQREAAPALLVH